MQESAKAALSWIRAHAAELTLRGVAADSPFATVEANASASLLDESIAVPPSESLSVGCGCSLLLAGASILVRVRG